MTALLLLTLVLPAAGALLTLAIYKRSDRVARIVAAVAAGAAFVTSVPLYWNRSSAGWAAPTGAGHLAPIRPWHQIDVPWASLIELRFHIGVDGISYPLVVLTTLLTLLCCVYTVWRVPTTDAPDGAPRGALLSVLLLVIEIGILGVFLALNLVLFFVFFETVLLPMYAVIVGWGGPARRVAGRKFVLYTLFGSVLLLVGVFLVVSNAGTAELTTLSGASSSTLAQVPQVLAFALIALGLAVKSPLWPLHTWLPDAHTEAPTVGSVILAGVLLKMGTYGLLRIAVGVLPDGARKVAPILGVLAVAAILYGGLACLAQTELKRLIAYSSVGHMGFVVLGIATLTPTGFQASLIGNIAHGIITGLLFFLAGAIKDRAHTGDLAELGGLRESLPRLSGLLGYAAIASLGLPGLAGFWGEAFAVIASIRRGGSLWVVLGVLAAFGGALAAAYFLRLLRRVTHGPATPLVAGMACAQIAGYELVSWAPLVLLAIIVGLIPALVLGMAHDPVQALSEVVHP